MGAPVEASTGGPSLSHSSAILLVARKPMYDVFISYARADKDFVRKLHQGLEEINRDIWIDWQDIPPTAEWHTEIFASIAAAHNFLFIVSPTSAL
jgi:hypothetical protein